VKTALRWSRILLAADLALIILFGFGPAVAELLGADIQQTKWPLIFYGGLLIILGAALSLICLCLQIAVAVGQRRMAR
jgi:hypothetical protein